MFIAHLPSGYIGACLLTKDASSERTRQIFLPFMIGGIFPDLDMFYFYLVDARKNLHHEYWTHLPVFWLAALAATLLIALISRSKGLAAVSTAFVAGVFLHLILDTPFGGIAWLYPLSYQSFHLVTVPATRSWWVWSFVLHWTFVFEIAICIWAVALFIKRRLRRGKQATS